MNHVDGYSHNSIVNVLLHQCQNQHSDMVVFTVYLSEYAFIFNHAGGFRHDDVSLSVHLLYRQTFLPRVKFLNIYLLSRHNICLHVYSVAALADESLVYATTTTDFPVASVTCSVPPVIKI